MLGTLWGFDEAAVIAFRTAYWLAQPPAVRALQTTAPADRLALAQQLGRQGYKIDEEIMVWGAEPLIIMTERVDDGYTWIPNAMQPDIPTAPGDDLPGIPPYDPKNPPPGSIKVSNNIADYPPFDPPPAPTAPITIPVGPTLAYTMPVTINGQSMNLPVFGSSAPQHFAEGFTVSVADPIPAKLATVGVVAGKYYYHLLGNELMNLNDRTGVWLLLPAGN